MSKTILLLVISYSSLANAKPMQHHKMEKLRNLQDISTTPNHIKDKLYATNIERKRNEPKQVSEKCCVEYEPQDKVVKGITVITINIIIFLLQYKNARPYN